MRSWCRVKLTYPRQPWTGLKLEASGVFTTCLDLHVPTGCVIFVPFDHFEWESCSLSKAEL